MRERNARHPDLPQPTATSPRRSTGPSLCCFPELRHPKRHHLLHICPITSYRPKRSIDISRAETNRLLLLNVLASSSQFGRWTARPRKKRDGEDDDRRTRPKIIIGLEFHTSIAHHGLAWFPNHLIQWLPA